MSSRQIIKGATNFLEFEGLFDVERRGGARGGEQEEEVLLLLKLLSS